MRDGSWLELVDCVLRPPRPDLARCVRDADAHVAARRPVVEARARAVAGCVARIEELRAAAFAAGDGVVTRRMTLLEREWRTLSRPDHDAGLMDLWARIAPPSWLDRKRWRDSEPALRVEAAVVLAADVEGVVAAETAVASLRSALAAWGLDLGARVRWRATEAIEDRAVVEPWLAEPLGRARESIVSPAVVARADAAREAVAAAALARFPERPLLAHDLAHAAMVDALLASLRNGGAAKPDPVAPLRALWRTGYVIAHADASGVTLEIPPRVAA